MQQRNASVFFIISLCVVAVGLPLSKPLISIGQLLMALELFSRGVTRENPLTTIIKNIGFSFVTFFRNKVAVIFSLIFFLHVIGLLWTEDFNYATKDIRIKIPLFLFPFFFANAPRIVWNKLRVVLLVFVVAVIASTLCGFAAWKGLIKVESSDSRNLSLFVSHIRLGLMICLSICILLYYAYHSNRALQRILFIILILWLAGFLFILQSVTAIIILALLILISASYVLLKRFHLYYSLAFLVFIAATIFGSFTYLRGIAAQFPDVKIIDSSLIKEKNSRGRTYFTNEKFPVVENGNYVWLNVQFEELKEAWKERTGEDLTASDRKGNRTEYTLVRYLASKNLPKEKEGVHTLTDEEISLIKKGVTNGPVYHGNKFHRRIYEMFWEMDSYSKGGNPSGNSAAMRIELWKNGWAIFRDHPIIGVGTGDVQNEFRNYFEKRNSVIEERFRHLRTHNQYLTIAFTFGILGLCVFIFAFLYPLFSSRFYDYLFISMFIISAASMINEDTLETQQGASFFAFFFSLLFFRDRKTLAEKL